MNKKRLLSFLVAMCMIVALIPAGIAPAAAANPIVINLNRGSATADLTLNATPTLATFASGCGFEVATVGGATNIKNLIAQSNCILVQGNANNALAVLKVKAPAGEYKVSIKVPDITAGTNAGILSFKIGGVIGDKAYRYTGGTDLGNYNFAAAGAMGTTHTFENTVTLTGEEHQLAIAFKESVAGNGYAWGAIESLIFTPVVEITEADTFGDVSAYITKDGTFTAFAGIDSTNYKEVGFIINGDYVPVENNAVYESIKVTSTKEETITSADFFKSTSPTKPYVFFSSKTVTGTVTFKPYAVPVDGDYDDAIVGHEYSVTLS